MIMSDNWLVKQQYEDIKLLTAENKRLEAKVKRVENFVNELIEMIGEHAVMNSDIIDNLRKETKGI